MKPRGAQKIAAVLLGLDKEAASALLRELPEGPLESLSQAMVELSSHPSFSAGDTQPALEEYWNRICQGTSGVNDFQQLLSEALGQDRADAQMRRLAVARGQGSPFSGLERFPSREVADVLMDESEQVCALALSSMRPGAAARILEHLEPERRASIVKRIAELAAPPLDIVEEVAASLLERFGPVPPLSGAKPQGLGVAASILNYLSHDAEQGLADILLGEDAELYQAIDERRVTMEDLISIDKKSMQKILAGVDTRVLTLALKGAPKDVENAILENVSKRSRETILEERDLLGALPVSEVAAARKEILDQVRALIKTGDVVLRRGSDDDIIE